MICLRITTHNVETGERTMRVRIPLALVRLAAKTVPASAFRLFRSDVDTDSVREILRATPEILDGLDGLDLADDDVPTLLFEGEERRAPSMRMATDGSAGAVYGEPYTEKTVVWIE